MILRRILRRLGFTNNKAQIMAGSSVDQHCQIGDHTYIGYNTFVTKSKIGRYCSIANNVTIGPGEHDMNLVSTNSLFYPNAYEKLTLKDITIGHDVWIGVNAVIRRGVTIGNGAVIGANAFVNTDVPAYAIFAGTPAKLIRMRFTSDKIDKIEKSKWWEQPPAQAQKIMESLN